MNNKPHFITINDERVFIMNRQIIRSFNLFLMATDSVEIEKKVVNNDIVDVEFILNTKKDEYVLTLVFSVSCNRLIDIYSTDALLEDDLFDGIKVDLHDKLNVYRNILYDYSKDCKEKLNVIYSYDNKCPICESKLEYRKSIQRVGHEKFQCVNDCYRVVRPSEDLRKKYPDDITGFAEVINPKNKGFHLQFALKGGERNIKSTIKCINYWKENDRYLIKILGVD